LSKFKKLVKQILFEVKHYLLTPFNLNHLSAEDCKLIQTLDEEGYVVIPGFFTAQECEDMRNRIDSLMSNSKLNIWRDKLNADKRIYGADMVDEKISGYFRNPRVHNLVTTYEKNKAYEGFTMAARLDFAEKNKGSGEGWHRDRSDTKQTKFICYLSDVNSEQGPFQFIKKSHKPWHLLKDYFKYGSKILDTRMNLEFVDEMIKNEPHRLVELTAPAGTLVIADTRGIHRGKPIGKNQTRFAITNYYWFDMPIPHHIRDLMVAPYSEKNRVY
jgi:hypothetical protein